VRDLNKDLEHFNEVLGHCHAHGPVAEIAAEVLPEAIERALAAEEEALKMKGEIAGLKGEIEYLTSDERKECPIDKRHATTERLWQWARETLTGEIADQFWQISANGYLMLENPEYRQRINILRHNARQAKEQAATLTEENARLTAQVAGLRGAATEYLYVMSDSKAGIAVEISAKRRLTEILNSPDPGEKYRAVVDAAKKLWNEIYSEDDVVNDALGELGQTLAALEGDRE